MNRIIELGITGIHTLDSLKVDQTRKYPVDQEIADKITAKGTESALIPLPIKALIQTYLPMV